MSLTLKLTPRGRVIINGCMIRNDKRTQSFTVENKADILLENHMITQKEAEATISGRISFMIQTALINPEARDRLVPQIHEGIAKLAGVFGPDQRAALIEAGTEVSQHNFFKAMRCLKPVRERESELIDFIKEREAASETADRAEP